jgi:peptide/nickel transport system permease protein
MIGEVNNVNNNNIQTESSLISEKKNTNSKLRWIKFFLIPGWRDPRISEIEYEIGKVKSKRRIFTKLINPLTIIGLLLVLFFIFLAIFPPWLTPYLRKDISQTILGQNFGHPPFSENHPFGTTKYDWDLLGRLIWGSRTGLTIGIRAIAISVIGGVSIGTIAAYFGGVTDSIIMRIVDLMMAFPGAIITLLVVTAFGYSVEVLIIVSGILSIPGYARYIRGTVLQIKTNLYIDAARVSGSSHFNVMFRHILPNSLSPIIIAVSSDIGSIVLGLAGLGFLGFGDESLIDWGTDLNFGREYLFSQPYASIYPGIYIALCVLGFMFLGDGLRDALDPRSTKKE